MDKVKRIINLALAGVAAAMGIAVFVFNTIDADFSTGDSIKMLAFAIVALGLFALNNLPKIPK